VDERGFSYDFARREVRRALGRFRRTPPWRVASDALRAARLHRSDPVSRAPDARPERLVVALTTVPDRLARILPALRSLLDQSCMADRLLLAWPSHSRRTGERYPPPPILPAGIELLPCEDEGPASKLLPALRVEPGAVIVVADDDVIYPVDFLATLLRAHRADPKAALGWRGWRFRPGADPRDYDHIFATAVAVPTTVDVLLGTWGYLVPPHALDDAVHDFAAWPPEVRWVDDVWISGHLARRGIPRRVVPAKGLPIETRASSIAALTDGLNRSSRNDRIAIEAFKAWW
jgi:hypothetical protein